MAAMRPGDWLCPSCGNHNYASKVACNRCQVPKPPDAGQANMGGSRPGVWGCASCGNQNYVSQGVCNKCQLPRAPNGGGFGPVKGASAKGAGSVAPGKGAGGFVSQNHVAPYAMAPPAAVQTRPAQPAAPAQMRPGDWCCASCGNHNYASKMACNKCQIPKMQSMMGMSNMMPNMMPNVMSNMMPGAKRPGDWKCHACGNNNYASRTSCNKKGCGVPKTVFVAKSGMRPGDWLCPMCDNHNYADKAACKKCFAPRGNAPPSMANMKEGDWLCPGCNNHNYKDKIACNRCQAPKQVY